MNRGNMKQKNAWSQRKGIGMKNNDVRVGRVRTGMHQRNEFEYRKAMLNAGIGEPEMEKAEEALDLPETLEQMIPQEGDAPIVIAEIAADEEVLEFAEEESEAPEDEVRMLNAVDYAGSRIPVMDPVTGGVGCEPHVVIYDSGDGTVRSIPDPLGVLTEDGIYPFFPEVKDPSANVAAIV